MWNTRVFPVRERIGLILNSPHIYYQEKKMAEKTKQKVDILNIYQLDGRVPIGRAIPFGLQHVLAMFVANLAPIIIVAGAVKLDSGQTAMLVQNAMLVAGIASLVQLYPVWKIGARLPIVMGVSFTFVTILIYVGVTYGYPAIIGAFKCSPAADLPSGTSPSHPYPSALGSGLPRFPSCLTSSPVL
jgi:hypothetical protein